MSYFEFFPKQRYTFANSSFTTTKTIRNTTLRTKILNNISKTDPYLYFDYIIREDERAEDIAYFYYENVEYTWIIYLSNDIIDPVSQWPKSDRDFSNFIRKKYKNLSGNEDPLVWTRNTTIDDNIVQYRNIANNTLNISKDSYEFAQKFNPDFFSDQWRAIRYYDYEQELNEQFRNIKLLNEKYASTAEKNLRSLLSE